MIVLPIVERELRVAARRRGTYRVRVLVALAAILVFGVVLWALTRQGMASSQHGRFLFRTLLVVGFGYCLLAGVRATADCLSEEKREGTLGLLFLTDLKGYDVVLGKLAANSLNSIYGLVAILPVQALSLQLGGVTPGELARSALLLLDTLFFSLAAGLFVSVLSRDERKAMFATVFVLGAVTAAPAVGAYVLTTSTGWYGYETLTLAVLSLSPAFGLGYLVTNLGPGTSPPVWLFWTSMLWLCLVTVTLLGLTARILPRIWQTRAKQNRAERFQADLEQRLYGGGLERRRFRRRLLEVNPFLWLAQRERGKPVYVWGYLAAVGGTWLWGWRTQGDVMFDWNVVAPTLVLVHGFFKIWVVSEACTRLAHDRANGALELLLSTPLTPAQILRGQWLALRRQFLRPLVVLGVVEYLLLRRVFAWQLGLMSVAVLAMDFGALGWVGMWLGLSAKSLTRALLGTVVLLLVVPWLVTFAAWTWLDFVLAPRGLQRETMGYYQWVWFGLGLASSALWGWGWGRRQLRRRFRQAAMQRYQEPPPPWWARWLTPGRHQACTLAADSLH